MGYITVSNQAFDTITDLSKQTGAEDGVVVYVSASTTINDRGGGNFRWSASSTQAPDGINVIQVTDVPTGRWTRLRNNNYNTGSTSFAMSTLIGATYVVNHGLPFTPAAILLVPTNAAAASGNWFVSAITPTTFTITYGNLLSLVAGTATYNFLAVR